MEMKWNLNDLYSSFTSSEFIKDCENIDSEINNYENWIENLKNEKVCSPEIIIKYLTLRNKLGSFLSRLSSFAELSFSVNTSDQQAVSYMEFFEKKQSHLEVIDVKFIKWFSKKKPKHLELNKKILKDHSFHLLEIVSRGKHMLDGSKEKIISDMKATGSSSWANLHNILTSTLQVDFVQKDGSVQQKSLPVTRNMAYSGDPETRKNGYDAELKSYHKIEKSVAACLNGIKGEVITTSKLRSYKTPLEMTLIKSRMEKKTLDSMMKAIKKYLPVFRKYYRKKASMLGHKNGLPFYDLFAPVGKSDMVFTYKEASYFIIEKFASFSKELSLFAKTAFEKGWIDAEPREGKVGGAFCANLKNISQSRILSNFSGSFNDVRTLAHELGHAYHGHCLNNESFLNSNYPMPLAETASIFCETIINHAALQKADSEQKISILEADISTAGQVIVDIYSRYLFETEVFKKRMTGSLSVEQLKEIMLNAQIEAYGDGLDPKFLHPYMWLVKPHYYFADWNFYNFPYAFGLLFSKGLYALYLQGKNDFVKNYDKLLSETGRKNIIEIGQIVNVNMNDAAFWTESLELIKEDVQKFLEI